MLKADFPENGACAPSVPEILAFKKFVNFTVVKMASKRWYTSQNMIFKKVLEELPFYYESPKEKAAPYKEIINKAVKVIQLQEAKKLPGLGKYCGFAQDAIKTCKDVQSRGKAIIKDAFRRNKSG